MQTRPRRCWLLHTLAATFLATAGVGAVDRGEGRVAGRVGGSAVSADGRFRIEGVNAGNYRFSVSGGVDGKPARLLPDRRGLEPDRLPERVTLSLISEEEGEKPHVLATNAWIDR